MCIAIDYIIKSLQFFSLNQCELIFTWNKISEQASEFTIIKMGATLLIFKFAQIQGALN